MNLKKYGLTAYNKPKRTPNHPTKSHIVAAKKGNIIKIIRFGQQGAQTNKSAAQRRAFRARHAKNIAKGILFPAYWSNKVKWKGK